MKSMKKILSVMLVLSLSVLLLAGCKKEGNNADGNKVFLIGGSGPLSGKNASYGTSVKQGAEIAVEEINAAGGVKVGDETYTLKLRMEDDEAEVDKAVTAYNTLMDAGVNVIMGNVTSGATSAITDLTKKDGILQLTPSGSEESITKNDNVFRLCFTDPVQGISMADYAYDELGHKTIAILYDSSENYSTGIMDAFIEQYESKGGTIVAKESFAGGDVDFTTQLTAVKDKNPAAIFIPAYYQEAAYIINQAYELGMKIPFLGSDGWDGVLAQVANPAAAEGAIFLSPFLASDTSEQAVSFVTKYKEKYKSAIPDQFAADGYDSIYVIVAAMKEAGTIKNSDLIAAMTKINVKGLTGDITFSENGEPNKGAKFIAIENGEYKIK